MPRLMVLENSPRAVAGLRSPVKFTPSNTPRQRNAAAIAAQSSLRSRSVVGMRRSAPQAGASAAASTLSSPSPSPRSTEKTPESKAAILAELQKHFVIQQLPRSVHSSLADAMERCDASTGEVIILSLIHI